MRWEKRAQARKTLNVCRRICHNKKALDTNHFIKPRTECRLHHISHLRHKPATKATEACIKRPLPPNGNAMRRVGSFRDQKPVQDWISLSGKRKPKAETVWLKFGRFRTWKNCQITPRCMKTASRVRFDSRVVFLLPSFQVYANIIPASLDVCILCAFN